MKEKIHPALATAIQVALSLIVVAFVVAVGYSCNTRTTAYSEAMKACYEAGYSEMVYAGGVPTAASVCENCYCTGMRDGQTVTVSVREVWEGCRD